MSNKEQELYGKVLRSDGTLFHEGFTLDTIIEMAATLEEQEITLYDLLGDLSHEPRTLIDLASRVKELDTALAATTEMFNAEHELAGITINNECQKVQSIALAHGIMASLIEAKKHWDIASNEFAEFEKVCQARIAQCVVQLNLIGMSAEEVQSRILQGY